jgi:hypothetical protein
VFSREKAEEKGLERGKCSLSNRKYISIKSIEAKIYHTRDFIWLEGLIFLV